MYIPTDTNPESAARIKMEVAIIETLVDTALAAGYALSVDDGGEEYALVRSANRKDILDALYNTDDDRIYYHDRGAVASCGWVYLVYGNDGWDVVCDSTTNLSEHLAPVEALAEKLEEGAS